jgi:phage terminase large subunit-like protein
MHESEFRRWHLGQWTAGEEAWINAPLWDSCAEKPSLDTAEPTILGVDAAIRHDTFAVATVQKHKDTYHAEFKIWEPAPGKEVQIELVVEFIREQCRKLNVTGVCFDPYFMHHAAQILENEGVPMYEWKQDNARMVPATRTLHEAVVNQKLRHGGDMTARSHALAAGVYETERGLRIKKTAGSGPNDAVVALAMAVEWASRQDPVPRKSVYDTQDLLVV